jgi:hypothetical protein
MLSLETCEERVEMEESPVLLEFSDVLVDNGSWHATQTSRYVSKAMVWRSLLWLFMEPFRVLYSVWQNRYHPNPPKNASPLNTIPSLSSAHRRCYQSRLVSDARLSVPHSLIQIQLARKNRNPTFCLMGLSFSFYQLMQYIAFFLTIMHTLNTELFNRFCMIGFNVLTCW